MAIKNLLNDLDWRAAARLAGARFKHWLANPVPLSFSKIGTYQNCPYKYHVIYDQHQPGKPSPALAVGTVMHNTLYAFESITAKDRGFADLERLYRRHWDMEIGEHRRRWGSSLYQTIAAEKGSSADEHEKESFEKGILVIKNYWANERNNPNKVRYVEKWVFAELFKYHITGRIDRIDQRPDGSYQIIDYKTGERIYDQTTLKDASRGYGLQAGLYYEMSREAWRDRVSSFVFRYLQKKQSMLDHLLESWMEQILAASRQALAGNASGAARPERALMRERMIAKLDENIRDKLREKLLAKFAAEREEERIRGELKKISPDEEERLLEGLDGASLSQGRAFVRGLNRSAESRVNDGVRNAIADPIRMRDYYDDANRALEAILARVDPVRSAVAVDTVLDGYEAALTACGTGAWPDLDITTRQTISGEIVDIIHHQDAKDRTERKLRNMEAAELRSVVEAMIPEYPELDLSHGRGIASVVVEELKASYPRHFDVYTIDDVARRMSENAPEGYLRPDYRERIARVLDGIENKATMPGDAAGAERRGVMLKPLHEAFKRLLKGAVLLVADSIGKGQAADLTEVEKQRYIRILTTLGDPIFTHLAAQKIAEALSKSVFGEIHFAAGVVPVTKHITDLFERPDVAAILASQHPDWDPGRVQSETQSLIEKLDWRDVETIVEDAFRISREEWRKFVERVIAPGLRDAVTTISSPEAASTAIEEAAILFENRLHRIVAHDVEVPYSPEMRENIRRVLDDVQDGIRKKDFSMAKGSLCGWCEYQSGCPAWCQHRSLCEGVCKDVYNCRKWYDAETGRLRDDRPKEMSAEEFERRIREKFVTTDRSLFRLSFSKMNTYDLCPMNYRKLYLDHCPPQPKAFFSIGLSYHSTMEDLFVYDGPHKHPSLEKVKEMFKAKWISAGYRSAEEEDFYFRRGLRMCEDYHAKFITGKYRRAYATEEYFEFRVGKTLLNGFIDRVDRDEDGQFTIVDYKTNPKMYTQEELEDDQQMTMYYLAAREGKLGCSGYKPFEPKQFVFQFVNFCKELVTHRKAPDLDVFVDRVSHFTDEIEWRQKAYKASGFDPRIGMLLFPPKENKYCQSCDHHHICPLKSDVTVSQEIEKKGIHFEDIFVDAEAMAQFDDRTAEADSKQ